jgi:chromosomal replication initiation ATPase DnaA
MGAVGQLPLSLAHPPNYRRDDFVVAPSNAAALALIERWPDWPSPVVTLTGPAGSGKTHLVRIWAAAAAATIVAAAGLGAASLPENGPVAVEDVGGDLAETALFHLVNEVAERGQHLLLTAREPPERWPIALPDLKSRLRLATPAAVGAPDDDLLRRVLVKLFADRQLLVERSVIDYLLNRMDRSFAAAAALVDSLDRAALAEGRRITRALAARFVGETAPPEPHFPNGKGVSS